MDIVNDFKQSCSSLMKNKAIILPRLACNVISVSLLAVLIFSTGLAGVVSEYSSLVNRYNQEHNAITGQSGQKLSEYLAANGFDASVKFMNLVNLQNAVISLAIITIILLIAYYLRAFQLAMTASVVGNKKLVYKKIMGSSFRLMFRLGFYDLLCLLAVGVPILLMILTVLSFFAVSKWLGILSFVIVLFLALAYVFFMIVKFIFASPIIFIENGTAFSSLKKSYSITKGRMKQACIVFAVIFGIGLGFGFGGNTYSNAFFGLLAFDNFINFALDIFVVMLFFIVSSAAHTFIRMFLFYAYIDFKSEKNGKSAKNFR